jgi:crossover junction endodeoxyribonuclease RuvC
MSLNKDRIIGIDPGTNILGFGIIEIKDNKASLMDMNVLHLKSFPEQQDKLREIFLRIQEIIEAYQPGYLSIELPFYGKNAQSMLKLGRAQGVAIAAAMVMGVEITEFSAKKIKQAITGNGNASKEQVASMLSKILHVKIDIKYLDATDALAAALCLYFQKGRQSLSTKGPKNWESYIAMHPDKVNTK